MTFHIQPMVNVIQRTVNVNQVNAVVNMDGVVPVICTVELAVKKNLEIVTNNKKKKKKKRKKKKK